jgi:hypothetical protein
MWQDVNGGNLVPKPDLARQDKMNTRSFVERDNSLPEAVRADFAPIVGTCCCFRLRSGPNGGCPEHVNCAGSRPSTGRQPLLPPPKHSDGLSIFPVSDVKIG